MNVPSEPIIYKRPLTHSDSVELYWQAPIYHGSSSINSYIIECSNIGLVKILPSSENKCIINNLKIGTNYTFTIKASNYFGNGKVAIYNSVIPGFLPNYYSPPLSLFQNQWH